MFENFTIYALSTWFISQTLKLVFKSGEYAFSKKHVAKVYFLYSGAPSSHSAVLAVTMLYMRSILSLDDPVFLITLIFSIMWLYEIFMQRKRYIHLRYLIENDNNKHHVNYMKEFHGHAMIDIISGLGVGTFMYNVLRIFGI